MKKITNPSDNDIEKPEIIDKMIEFSEKLSEYFSYVRVDWYYLDGILYYGELTFHHEGGNRLMLPEV